MAIVQQLSVLAVRTLFEGFCRSIGFEAGGATATFRFLGARLDGGWSGIRMIPSRSHLRRAEHGHVHPQQP